MESNATTQNTVFVFDFENSYELSVQPIYTWENVLDEYFRVSQCPSHNIFGEKLTYFITTHSNEIYSVRSAVKGDSSRLLHSLMGVVDIADWWAKAYPIISQIADVAGALTGVAAIFASPFYLIKWIRNKIREKSIDEHTWIQECIAHDTWNASELASILSITVEQSKSLLKGFGYKWDNHKMLYVATETTEKLRNVKADIDYN